MALSKSSPTVRLKFSIGYCNVLMARFLLILITTNCKDAVVQATVYPALFTFGDSLVDNGNNNYLASLARANYPPNGCDYVNEIATGRFCNGYTLSDYIGIYLGIAPPPAYFDHLTFNLDIKKGVNFASGAGGILDESGYNYLERIPMSQQIEYFALVKKELTGEIGNTSVDSFLANSLFVIVLGSNDYINNYMLPGSVKRSMFTPDEYADLLVSTYSQHILKLYEIGARKILMTSLGPLGCLPYEMWKMGIKNGECSEEVNNWVHIYNNKLKVLVQSMPQQIPDLYLLLANAFDKVYAYIQTPREYGFQYANVSCCGGGMYGAETLCLPTASYCNNRSEYVFWDRFHPSDRCNSLISSYYVSGAEPDVLPMNLLQLADK